MMKRVSRTLRCAITAMIVASSSWLATPLSAASQSEAEALAAPFASADTTRSIWVREPAADQRGEPSPPTKLAIIACRVHSKPKRPTAASGAGPDWLLPLECMRVIETVSDAAATRNLWLRQMTPNLAQYGTCASVAMSYAAEWEASHRSWLVVKIGCPTKIVDADGRTIGWHMPECQGTLPGTRYPLRCRFDPSEI